MPRPASLSLAALAVSLVLASAGGAARAQAEAPDPALPPRAAPALPAASKAAAKKKAKKPAKGKAGGREAAGDGGAAGAAEGAGPAAGATGAAGGEAPVDPYAAPAEPVNAPVVTVPPRLGIGDVAAMQGLFAVQRLDGWLLHDEKGENPVGLELTAPAYRPEHAWYYLLPSSGEPVLISHQADAAAFEKLAGRKVAYASARELQQALRAALKGKKTVAMELRASDKVGGKPEVEPGARGVLKALKVAVVSSEHLVQYTTAVWGEAGRISHHIAAHHLVELRKDALAYLAKQVRAGAKVTEYELQQRLVRGMAVRGVVGPPPQVAAGINTADPAYLPASEGSAVIGEGELVLIGLAARLDKPDAIFAAQTWMAYVGAKAPERATRLFGAVAQARDQAIAVIGERFRKRRPLRGNEVDLLVRAALGKVTLDGAPADGAGAATGAGAAQLSISAATGHSIDTSLDGHGADLVGRDARGLVAGTGVTIAPGLYVAGELGLRSEVTVFLAPGGPEVTTPAQQELEALLAP
jgi:Xaa-Pro aminopeptidase